MLRTFRLIVRAARLSILRCGPTSPRVWTEASSIASEAHPRSKCAPAVAQDLIRDKAKAAGLLEQAAGPLTGRRSSDEVKLDSDDENAPDPLALHRPSNSRYVRNSACEPVPNAAVLVRSLLQHPKST